MEPNEERQGNDKKAERLAKRRERRRQRLLEETAEEKAQAAQSYPVLLIYYVISLYK